MDNFIDNMKKMLDLFKQIHGRLPKDSDEFIEWCDHVEANKTTLNSRRDIPDC